MSVRFTKGKRGKRTAYTVQADREELRLAVDERFWDDAIIDDEGTTQLDSNIEQVCEEIRFALYYVATAGLPFQ